MQRILKRVKQLLDAETTVWMYADGENRTIAEITDEGETPKFKDWDGEEYEMTGDAADYTTVNYSAELFH